MSAVPESHRNILETAVQGMMSTIRHADGLVSTNPVGFDWDGEYVRISTLKSRVKYANLRANPQITFCVVDPLAPTRYIEIRGHAELIDDPGGELNRQIYRRHTGQEFDLDAPDAERVIVKIIPSQVSAPTLYGGKLDRVAIEVQLPGALASHTEVSQSDPLAALRAKDAIRERLHDYVRAMDSIDDDLGRSVFHPDAPADYGAIYQGTGHGFIDFVHAAHVGMLAHQHQLGSIGIVVDGERAASETYVTVTLRMRSPEGLLQDSRSHGRYLDQWEQRNGRWAISARQYVHLFDDLYPVHLQQFETGGSRNPEDPSYALFAGRRG